MSRKECPNITGLKFDKESIEAIDSINTILKNKETGWWVNAIGQLIVIFGGLAINARAPGNIIEKTHIFKVISSDLSQTSYSIHSANWEYFFKTFTALDRYANNQIETIAGMQMLRSGLNGNERLFWKAVHYGCKVK